MTITTRKRIINVALWLIAVAVGENFSIAEAAVAPPNVTVSLGVSNASVVLLDSVLDILYVGARDTILALDPKTLSPVHQPIKWLVPKEKIKECTQKGKTEEECQNYICLLERLSPDDLYVCGTFGFDPQCAFIDPVSFTLQTGEDGGLNIEKRKGMCPYEPGKPHTSVTAGGNLYSASSTNFLGTEFDIARVRGGNKVRLQKGINFLKDPKFVSSVLIKSAEDQADDHIYWFFTENAIEYNFFKPVRVSRVARTCTGDEGGSKTLQGLWTSFLKAPLVCEEEGGRRYDVLKHLFSLEHSPGHPETTHFYGLFTSDWGEQPVSAVCVYSVSDVAKVMATSRFANTKSDCQSGGGVDPPPGQRPGQCITAELGALGIDSSLKLPDQLLTFAKDHPLLLDRVEAGPLLVRKGVAYTSLAVGNVTGTDVAVIYLGTAQGELHSVLLSGQSVSQLKEFLLTPPDPIHTIIIREDHALALAASSGLRVPVSDCGSYPSCGACVGAQALGCRWAAEGCGTGGPTRSLEAVGEVDERMRCGTTGDGCPLVLEEIRVPMNLTVVLPCLAPLSPSPLSCVWSLPEGQHSHQLPSGSLLLRISSSSDGLYSCRCPQPGQPSLGSCPTASYQLVLEDPKFGGRVDPNSARSPVGVYLAFILLGALFGALVSMLYIYRRSNRNQQSNNNRNQQFNEYVNGASGTAPGHSETDVI